MAELILLVSELYSLIILARVLMSWVQMDPYSPLARVIHDLTEPVLAPVRNMMPQTGMFDFSPIIVLIGVQILGVLLANMFAQAGL